MLTKRKKALQLNLCTDVAGSTLGEFCHSIWQDPSLGVALRGFEQIAAKENTEAEARRKKLVPSSPDDLPPATSNDTLDPSVFSNFDI